MENSGADRNLRRRRSHPAAATHYLQVFRVVGTVAFLACSGAVPLDSIWKGQKWSSTVKHVIDRFIYAIPAMRSRGLNRRC